MKVMGVKGLTLYHLKSHLQKFRLGKQPHKEFNDHSAKDGERALDRQRNVASPAGLMGQMPSDCHIAMQRRMQLEVQRRLHEQLEVQKHLQMRIEAQGRYMQSILEKACQSLGGENVNMTIGSFGSNNSIVVSQGIGDVDSPMTFNSFFGGADQHPHMSSSAQQQHMTIPIWANQEAAAAATACLGSQD